jgi:hypothetical protein
MFWEYDGHAFGIEKGESLSRILCEESQKLCTELRLNINLIWSAPPFLEYTSMVLANTLSLK